MPWFFSEVAFSATKIKRQHFFVQRQIKVDDLEGSSDVSEESVSNEDVSTSQEVAGEKDKKQKEESEQASLKDAKGYLLFYTLAK